MSGDERSGIASRTRPMLASHPHLRPWCAIHQAMGVVMASVKDADWRAELVEQLATAAAIVQEAGDGR